MTNYYKSCYFALILIILSFFSGCIRFGIGVNHHTYISNEYKEVFNVPFQTVWDNTFSFLTNNATISYADPTRGIINAQSSNVSLNVSIIYISSNETQILIIEQYDKERQLNFPETLISAIKNNIRKS